MDYSKKSDPGRRISNTDERKGSAGTRERKPGQRTKVAQKKKNDRAEQKSSQTQRKN